MRYTKVNGKNTTDRQASAQNVPTVEVGTLTLNQSANDARLLRSTCKRDFTAQSPALARFGLLIRLNLCNQFPALGPEKHPT